MSVKNLEFTEEAGLRFDLTAIADHGDLHVRRVEVGASRGENIARSEGANFLAVCLEIVVRKFVERESGNLGEQATLGGQAHREDAGEIVLRVEEFALRDRNRTQLVNFVENFSKGGGDDLIANGGRDGEIAVLAERVDGTARAIGVALVLSDIHDQA